jgi:S-adenosylhomocysteine hydrolase
MKAKSVSAFHLYQTLASTPRLPRRAADVMRTLRACAAANGGIICRDDLPSITDPSARELARYALHFRAMLNVLEHGFPVPFVGQHPAQFFLRNLEALAPAVLEQQPVLSIEELDQPWLASHLARAMTVYAWNTQARPDMGTSRCLLMAVPELTRFIAIDRDLRALPESHRERNKYIAMRERAAKEALLVAMSGCTDPEAMKRALKEAPAGFREIYRWSGTHALADPLGEPPHVAQSLLDGLGLRGLYGLRVAASNDQLRELGRFPVLEATTAMLRERGLLAEDTFQGLVFGSRIHGLGGFAAFQRVLVEHGLDPSLALLKGYSTNPIAAVTLARRTKIVDTGIGQSRRAPESYVAHLASRARRLLEQAVRRNHPVLFLGDGWESAEALDRARRKVPAAKVAYVENTQSGLNYLGTLDRLPFDVVMSLADANIKKLFDESVVGSWIVPRVMEGETRKKEELSAAVLGYGFVGRGTAASLEDHARRIIVVEGNEERALRARKDGFEVVAPRSDGSVPEADYYFACTGVQSSYGRAAFESSKPGSKWTNCGSTGDLDLSFLHRARKKAERGVLARVRELEKLPEHRTLELKFGSGRNTSVVHMGLPYFDGIRDKNPKFVDVMLSLRLATLAEAAQRIKAGQRMDRIGTLDAALLDDVRAIVERAYGG